MIIQIDKYVAEIENNSVLVLPATPRCRVKEQQICTFAEVYSTLRPNYVRDAVYRRVQHTGIIYLIHFDEPYKHARHYLGFTKDLDQRMLTHTAGRGARLMQVVTEAGINWQIARIWYGDRYEERRLKGRTRSGTGSKGLTKYCHICELERNKRKEVNYGQSNIEGLHGAD